MSIRSIGLFDAKTHLSELVAHAEQGGETVITRHNRPVARIVPYVAHAAAPAARKAALKALLKAASGRRLGMDWKALRDEGRK
ncbi:MAG TPA: type II toxin-antitoxin system prevent-host-death family antitoxin [Methylibium sp.]|uniref:type II toxin-antitoxin system Phd/YefM family antitoxin n=1 Tax=Methylibium sp. TaxID=2067992 RepID=UPI002DB6C6CA|nr:type II toxin-antitoxin system prevent-host-death family antitoxin [Methylibium sp.]HEU4458128.1 type II toxin-antitoxin system prevent-host-death family antitoxin [Methylibium sp.]